MTDRITHERARDLVYRAVKFPEHREAAVELLMFINQQEADGRSRPVVVDAEASERPRASTECPICGIGEPHAHDGVAIEAWLSNMVSRWGFKARVLPLEAQSRTPDRDTEPEKSDAALFYEDAATKNGGKT